uniref:Uncharacterized protein n=1 Tax=Siphoviridae sp. ctxMM9 TaxID=2827973 RepID=A0A8S5T6Q2_9CAUD|nr:MAG TPA: hypothetical protein [Siphoviridae sp. ctxMM9]
MNGTLQISNRLFCLAGIGANINTILNPLCCCHSFISFLS